MKSHICPRCNGEFATRQSLWNHKQRCRGDQSFAGQKRSRSPEIPTYSGYLPESDIPFIGLTSGADNVKPVISPKIQNLVDAIINESPKDQTITMYTPLVPIEKPTTWIAPVQELRPITIDEILQLPQPPPEIIAEIFPSKGPAQASKPRTKEDIMGYSESDGDDSEDDSMDIEDIHPPIKLLPATVDGLRARFNELYTEFMREKKHEHRNELVSILDDMLRQGGITKDEYTRLNNNLAESLVDEKEEPVLSREEKIKKLIQTTTEYLIEHDKKELVELINEFRKDEEHIDTVLELEELIEIFLEGQFLDGEPIMAKIDESRRKLESSRILKSKQHRLKMVLDDIAKNRHRVEAIIKHMMDASGEDISDTLKRLARHKLLSEEQYLKLADDEDYDAHKLAKVIKETKIGYGLKFLPRKLNDLTKSLATWLEELAETGSLVLKDKISSVLEELLRRKAITAEKYADIKEDNEIL